MVCGWIAGGGWMTGCKNGIIHASAMREKNGERMQDRGVWSHAPRGGSVSRVGEWMILIFRFVK